jgi:RsiW-degrading membrane proteinase PrsW (M82 family)
LSIFDQINEFIANWFLQTTVIGMALAIALGIVWLLGYWPPLFKKRWLWVVLIGSAAITFLVYAFVQIPATIWLRGMLYPIWLKPTAFPELQVRSWLLLAEMPVVVIQGLLLEGAKLLPVVIWFWRSSGRPDPKLGLAFGAVAGFGFGVLEAQLGLSVSTAVPFQELVKATGWLLTISRFSESFFTLGFHIAATALAGYGVARGWGWQFYILVSFLHALKLYPVVAWHTGSINTVQVEVGIAAVALLATGAALWLRWRGKGD